LARRPRRSPRQPYQRSSGCPSWARRAPARRSRPRPAARRRRRRRGRSRWPRRCSPPKPPARPTVSTEASSPSLLFKQIFVAGLKAIAVKIRVLAAPVGAARQREREAARPLGYISAPRAEGPVLDESGQDALPPQLGSVRTLYRAPPRRRRR